MPSLTIIRGLPGSGKSTLARSMGIRHYEADMYHTAPDGTYNYDPTRAAEAHGWCQYLTRESLEAGEDVVVSNTFTTYPEIAPYLNMAEATGATVEIIVCRGNYGTIHGVPQEVIEAMRARWVELPVAA